MSLKVRAATGVVFGAVMIGGTLAHQYSCVALFVLIAMLCLVEFYALTLVDEARPAFNAFRKGLAVTLGIYPILITLLWNFSTPDLNLFSFALVAFIPVFFGFFLLELFGKADKPFTHLGHAFLGMGYVGIPFALVVLIALNNPEGHKLIMAILFMIWASDSFAYLVGSKIGKNKMFPRISPGKTWEGTIGGFLGTLLVGGACFLVFGGAGIGLNPGFWLVLAGVCSIFGTLGDLVESMLKRSLGIKDSGNILPGHGGFLDRFDAFIFAVPFVCFVLALFSL